MTDEERSDYVEWVNKRLFDISKAPQMYGSVQEVVEFQYIQLLEFRDVIRHPERIKGPDLGSRYVIDKYIDFTSLKRKSMGRRAAGGYLSHMNLSWEEMMECLRQFNYGLEQLEIFKK